ncbi:unnamed protein product [Mytilus edulis]|uniref:B box-type domain-containing protein n=1 Tax=Mytilus edulis TaxID=6550 RepID=A0A8S3S2A0_MYTED|nr:unnamed protein product [Mytilus edulis]
MINKQRELHYDVLLQNCLILQVQSKADSKDTIMASQALKEKHMCMPCSFRDLSQEASFWCFVCKEGLCSSCKKHHLSIKALQSHDILPFEEHQSIPEILEQVQQTCLEHDRKFELYCSDHREPCCIRCSTLNHKGCQNVCLIEDVIANVQSSTAANHIEEGIDGMILKLHKIIERKKKLLVPSKIKLKVRKRCCRHEEMPRKQAR